MTIATQKGDRPGSIAPPSKAVIDDESIISLAREGRRGEFKVQANAAIAALFSAPAAEIDPLVWKEINMIGATMLTIYSLLIEAIDHLEDGAATPLAQLVGLRDAVKPGLDATAALFSDQIQPIRDAENAASAELDVAGDDPADTYAARLDQIELVPDVSSRLT